MDESFNALTRPALYEPDPDTMWKKIKAVKKLKGNTLSLLKRLAAWREITAREENQPRKWILPDHTLVEMASSLPTNQDELYKIKGMNRRLIQRHGKKLIDILQ